MKITKLKGNKTKEDKRIIVDAINEQVTMMEVGNLINQFNLNELKIIDEKENLSRDKHNWFPRVLEKALKDAKNGIEWAKLDLNDLLYLTKYPYFIKEKAIKKFVEERENENNN